MLPTIPRILTVGQDALLHGETLLVVSTGNLEDVALPFITEMVSGDFGAHTLVVEVTQLVVVHDLEGLLGPGSGKRYVQLPEENRTSELALAHRLNTNNIASYHNNLASQDKKKAPSKFHCSLNPITLKTNVHSAPNPFSRQASFRLSTVFFAVPPVSTFAPQLARAEREHALTQTQNPLFLRIFYGSIDTGTSNPSHGTQFQHSSITGRPNSSIKPEKIAKIGSYLHLTRLFPYTRRE